MYDFCHALECLDQVGTPFGSELARLVGKKGYHDTTLLLPPLDHSSNDDDEDDDDKIASGRV